MRQIIGNTIALGLLVSLAAGSAIAKNAADKYSDCGTFLGYYAGEIASDQDSADFKAAALARLQSLKQDDENQAKYKNSKKPWISRIGQMSDVCLEVNEGLQSDCLTCGKDGKPACAHWCGTLKDYVAKYGEYSKIGKRFYESGYAIGLRDGKTACAKRRGNESTFSAPNESKFIYGADKPRGEDDVVKTQGSSGGSDGKSQGAAKKTGDGG